MVYVRKKISESTKKWIIYNCSSVPNMFSIFSSWCLIKLCHYFVLLLSCKVSFLVIMQYSEEISSSVSFLFDLGWSFYFESSDFTFSWGNCINWLLDHLTHLFLHNFYQWDFLDIESPYSLISLSSESLRIFGIYNRPCNAKSSSLLKKDFFQCSCEDQR